MPEQRVQVGAAAPVQVGDVYVFTYRIRSNVFNLPGMIAAHLLEQRKNFRVLSITEPTTETMEIRCQVIQNTDEPVQQASIGMTFGLLIGGAALLLVLTCLALTKIERVVDSPGGATVMTGFSLATIGAVAVAGFVAWKVLK